MKRLDVARPGMLEKDLSGLQRVHQNCGLSV